MASTTASLVRSKSAPQPIAGLAPVSKSSKRPSIQRSASHVDVDKDSYTKRRVAAETTKSRQEPRAPPLAVPAGDPFNLAGFFPTSLSVIGNEEEEWRWMNEAGEEDGSVRGGWSAIFGNETGETIKREDKLGVLALKDVSLFGASAGEATHGYGGLLSPYASDEVVDENSLYLAQRARREQSTISAVVGGSGYGEVFLGSHVP
ncbi:hypothetical protein D9756_004056 [Leucocoprinus leucothites]|uniref:Uncharacterized protein n=1 Tax=Leucocoprinus leucothites TaxID=201217 RepID=A0A8H5DA62_9AGAR|nr:hypothetical protein D9756_004056 [Leucoagaricus leucothites]